MGFETLDFRPAVNAARAARLLVFITAHFRRDRLGYLTEVLRGLAEFPVLGIDVRVITNTDDAGEVAEIEASAAGLSRHLSLLVCSFPRLEDPWFLPWCHKPMIVSDFLAPHSPYSHLVYLEDDIALSFANFCYFVSYNEKLRFYGLLPAFHRYEIDDSGQYFSTDQFVQTSIHNRLHVSLDGLDFMNLENPHQAMFIMDRQLAQEYVRTRSYDLEQSATVYAWSVCERAQMGLCWEAVPADFFTRYVVPVHPTTLRSPRFCWVRHLPNTYVNNPNHPAGEIQMNRLFVSGEDRSMG